MPALPKTLTLRDGRVVLRDWREDDAPALEAVCGDPEVCRFTSVPWTFTQEAARDWVRRQGERRWAGTGLVLAITRADGGAALGNVNLVRFSENEAALGYWLVPAARGEGLAFLAARALCGWGFAHLNLERIELAIAPENAASHRLAERLGAVREGLRPASPEAGGRGSEMVIYSLAPGNPLLASSLSTPE